MSGRRGVEVPRVAKETDEKQFGGELASIRMRQAQTEGSAYVSDEDGA